jgi:hypothetical protein
LVARLRESGHVFVRFQEYGLIEAQTNVLSGVLQRL